MLVIQFAQAISLLFQEDKVNAVLFLLIPGRIGFLNPDPNNARDMQARMNIKPCLRVEDLFLIQSTISRRMSRRRLSRRYLKKQMNTAMTYVP
jgi:hypothetical protein